MTGIAHLFRKAGPFGALLLTGISITSAPAAQSGVTTTNFVDRWITNNIEVRIPANHFVNEYHTNWVEHVLTNILQLYATNQVTRVLTNTFVVDVTRTNFVSAYVTNSRTLSLTNWTTVLALHTNLVNRVLTNHSIVEVAQTNFVSAYSTNVKTLHLTNWATVVVLRTNWVTQPVTNVLSLDLARTDVVATEAANPATAAAAKPAVGETAPVLRATLTDRFTFEAARAALTPGRPAEVHLRARWKDDARAPLLVQQWKIERGDGAILCFGKDQEFQRALLLPDRMLAYHFTRLARAEVAP